MPIIFEWDPLPERTTFRPASSVPDLFVLQEQAAEALRRVLDGNVRTGSVAWPGAYARTHVLLGTHLGTPDIVLGKLEVAARRSDTGDGILWDMHDFNTVNDRPYRRGPSVPGVGNLLLLTLLGEFSRAREARALAWTEASSASEFYRKFFAGFGPLLAAQGLLDYREAGRTRRIAKIGRVIGS